MARLAIVLLAFILANSTSAQSKEIADSIFHYMPVPRHDDLNPNKTFFTHGATEVFDSTIAQSWSNNQWVNDMATRHTYSSDLREHVYFYEIFENNQWLGLDRNSFKYDESGNTIWKKYEECRDNKWVNRDQYFYDFNSDSYVYIYQVWNEGWINATRGTVKYESGTHFMKEILTDFWYGTWKNHDRIVITKDEANRTITRLYQLWRDNGWRNNAQYIFITNEDGSEEVATYYDKVNNDWHPKWRHIQKYDGNNILESVEQTWFDSTGWNNLSRHVYTYHNGNGLEAEEIYQSWSRDAAAWKNSGKYVFEYDDLSGEVKTVAWQNWYNESWVNSSRIVYDGYSGKTRYEFTQHFKNNEWVTVSRATNFYTPVESLGDRTVFPAFTLEQNYPNPFNPGTTIKFFLKENELVELKVYDMQGSEVAVLLNEEKPAGEHTVKFDGSSLASGVYFCRLKSGGFIETKKMILIK